MTAWNVPSAGGWPWRTCPIRRRRAWTCSWPAGRPQPCPTRGSRSTGSNRSGRARTSSEAACLSRRASTCRGPWRPIVPRARCATRGPTWRGARWEDWGQAPLEALADGALLATVPSGGPYEGLRLARRLDASLVADEIDAAALAPAIRAAFEMPDDARERLPRQSGRAAAPIPLGGGAGNGDPRAAARPARLAAGHSQDGSLPRLRVGLRRVAVRDRLASGRQALA